MPITIKNVGNYDYGRYTNPFDSPYTVPSGSNCLIICFTSVQGAVATAVTYNGISMTRATQNTDAQNGSIWYLMNPPTGSSYNINVTMNGTGNVIFLKQISLSGVASIPIGQVGNTFVASNSISVTLNGLKNKSLVINNSSCSGYQSYGFSFNSGQSGLGDNSNTNFCQSYYIMTTDENKTFKITEGFGLTDWKSLNLVEILAIPDTSSQAGFLLRMI